MFICVPVEREREEEEEEEEEGSSKSPRDNTKKANELIQCVQAGRKDVWHEGNMACTKDGSSGTRSQESKMQEGQGKERGADN